MDDWYFAEISMLIGRYRQTMFIKRLKKTNEPLEKKYYFHCEWKYCTTAYTLDHIKLKVTYIQESIMFKRFCSEHCKNRHLNELRR